LDNEFIYYLKPESRQTILIKCLIDSDQKAMSIFILNIRID